MQNAKDTFYVTLRNRLVALNPARTMILRAVTRPGILVLEAEAPMPQPALDAFALRWTSLETDLQMPAVFTRMTCEISYATAGSAGNAGLDRGRALEEMDGELVKMLYPFAAQKMNYATNPATTMNTQLFWSDPEFGPATTDRDRLSRTARVSVCAFQEQGEQ